MEWLFGKKMTPDEMLRKVRIKRKERISVKFILIVLFLFFFLLKPESASVKQSNARSGSRADEDGAARKKSHC